MDEAWSSSPLAIVVDLKVEKLDWSISWSGNVVHCGAKHDENKNVARNILIAGGHTETKKNGQVSQHKTTAKVTADCEMSTCRGSRAP